MDNGWLLLSLVSCIGQHDLIERHRKMTGISGFLTPAGLPRPANCRRPPGHLPDKRRADA